MAKRLALVTTHPIQYLAPWFRALVAHPEIELQVYFSHDATAKEQADAGFGVEFVWDTPILEGYSYRFLKNVAQQPSIHRFWGLDTPEIFDILRRENYDAVLVSGWKNKSAWQAIFAGKRTHLPVMIRGDSNLHTPRHFLKQLLKYPVYSSFISQFDACLPVGAWSREYFLHYGARKDRIFFVPHIVDNDYFLSQYQQWGQQRGEIRQGWQIAADSVAFLYCGKLNDQKHPLDFIRAVAQASKTDARVSGIMVGDGTLRGQCDDLIAQLGAPVQIVGFLNQSEIAKGYVAADVMVLPSDARETWGLVINEAMLARLPCILSDQVGSAPDLITPGVTGDTFPMGDVDALARLMIQYVQDPAALKRMGENALNLILERYSTQQAVEGVVQALHRVAR